MEINKDKMNGCQDIFLPFKEIRNFRWIYQNSKTKAFERSIIYYKGKYFL